jgi:aspartyl-tRNA(Asn)/glutamyl-tRNA(Gln) amidotransferase subunit A
MQLAGRPFDEATVLNAGHAYERATAWRSRRPQLTPGVAAPSLTMPATEKPKIGIDAPTRAFVDAAIDRAGLTLTDMHRALLYRVAPPVLAAVNRIPRNRPPSDEPANMFGFPAG